ncbi:phosphopantetheine binding protein [Krasilnikovia cinnamomea]|uniref:Phosphopantetheine binding protein n=1 Tax=Krasilnikovia cinnamomea TaxID=349313 RepID=A0A4Q7ZQH6_9ACTN|nr:phosphopantetheine-binding protein [Krasilnikovia cinnamomea]RZU53357.1 phosphopantetheine binding protein [Krasilnikovia cinnamomea]
MSTDDIDRTVAEVWADVLGVPEVQPTDGFFALGGHSLAALRVVYTLRDRLGVPLALRDLMAARTCADFAETVRAALRGDAPTRPLTPLVGRRGTR